MRNLTNADMRDVNGSYTFTRIPSKWTHNGNPNGKGAGWYPNLNWAGNGPGGSGPGGSTGGGGNNSDLPTLTMCNCY